MRISDAALHRAIVVLASTWALLMAGCLAVIVTGCAVGQGSTSGLANGPVSLSLIAVRSSQDTPQTMHSDHAAMGSASSVTAPGTDRVGIDPASMLKAAPQPRVAPYVAPVLSAPMPPSPAPYRPATGHPRTITVERGDTLWNIAQEHGCTVADLKRLNRIAGDRIMPGDRLVVP